MRHIQNRVNWDKYNETLYTISKRKNQTIHYVRKKNSSHKKFIKINQKSNYSLKIMKPRQSPQRIRALCSGRVSRPSLYHHLLRLFYCEQSLTKLLTKYFKNQQVTARREACVLLNHRNQIIQIDGSLEEQVETVNACRALLWLFTRYV